MQMWALPVLSKAGVHILPLPILLLFHHPSVRPGEPCTTQEHLIQEMPLASKRLSLDLASEICWRPRLAGEEGMHCLELLIIIYQENLLPLKPEFALCTRSEHTKLYFKLFKTIMQLAWIMFAQNSWLRTSDCLSCSDYIPSLILVFKWIGFKTGTYIT